MSRMKEIGPDWAAKAGLVAESSSRRAKMLFMVPKRGLFATIGAKFGNHLGNVSFVTLFSE